MRYFDCRLGLPLLHATSGLFISQEPWIHAKRLINTHVLILVKEGVLHIEQNGEKAALGPGQTMILFAGEEHKGYRLCDPGLSYYWCHFQVRPGNLRLLHEEEAREELSGISSGTYEGEEVDRILYPERGYALNAGRLTLLFKQLLHIANAGAYTRYSMDYCLTSILIEMTQQFLDSQMKRETVNAAHRDEQTHRFAEVLEWVRMHRKEALSVGGIADRFGYNPNYLSLQFKRYTGYPLIKYIHQLKINEARELLLNSDLSICQISYKLGFKSEKYFIRLFKAYEEMTPGCYRATYFHTHMNRY